jgi:uncharacterized protein with HEPN domain
MSQNPPSRDDTSLLDIAIAARRIGSYIDGTSRAAFMDDDQKQAAVLYRFVVMGEATKRLSAEVRSKPPQIPWRNIAGMRDRVTHGYDAVNLDVVWDIASEEVPALLAAIQPMLPVKSPTKADHEEIG